TANAQVSETPTPKSRLATLETTRSGPSVSDTKDHDVRTTSAGVKTGTAVGKGVQRGHVPNTQVRTSDATCLLESTTQINHWPKDEPEIQLGTS
ncbi:hypothetical protein AMTR_s00003p00221010, partial [Amborella trichopoda]